MKFNRVIPAMSSHTDRQTDRQTTLRETYSSQYIAPLPRGTT